MRTPKRSSPSVSLPVPEDLRVSEQSQAKGVVVVEFDSVLRFTTPTAKAGTKRPRSTQSGYRPPSCRKSREWVRDTVATGGEVVVCVCIYIYIYTYIYIYICVCVCLFRSSPVEGNPKELLLPSSAWSLAATAARPITARALIAQPEKQQAARQAKQPHVSCPRIVAAGFLDLSRVCG